MDETDDSVAPGGDGAHGSGSGGGSSDDVSIAHYQRALQIYQRDLVAWTLLYGAYTLVSILTMGIGLVLGVNVFRATRDAIAEDRPPDLSGLFRTDRLADDAVVLVVLVGGSMVASSVVGPLSFAVGILLGMAPPIVADERFDAAGAIKLSVGYALKEPVPCIVHAAVGAVLALPGICCLIPFPFVLPIAGIASWLFYEERRDAVLALAEAQGVRQLP